jgi:hypothetical protein
MGGASFWHCISREGCTQTAAPRNSGPSGEKIGCRMAAVSVSRLNAAAARRTKGLACEEFARAVCYRALAKPPAIGGAIQTETVWKPSTQVQSSGRARHSGQRLERTGDTRTRDIVGPENDPQHLVVGTGDNPGDRAARIGNVDGYFHPGRGRQSVA